MTKVTKIAHPLKNRRGSSQGTRTLSALNANAAPIDGRSIADLLCMIGDFSKQVNYYDYQKSADGSEQQLLSDWSCFFEKSLPFQLSRFSKFPIDELDSKFNTLFNNLNTNPEKENLDALLCFVYDELISPVSNLYEVVSQAQNSLSATLTGIIKSAMLEAVKDFICQSNATATFLCTKKINFMHFVNAPWFLTMQNIFAMDPCIQQVQGGKEEATIKAGKTLVKIVNQLLAAIRSISNVVPDFIEESLYPLEERLQEKHEPHLALIFTFLHLLKHVQNDVNQLTFKHLDYFYRKILGIQPKDAVPDKAHLVFEVAKHLEEYLLPKGLLLKDGKDANKQDIQFELDQEIVLDKTKIVDLRTLALPSIEVKPGNLEQSSYVNGAHIAPVANSADGLGAKFRKEHPENWATLGDKLSKQIDEITNNPIDHPHARIGFVLASPVLLLEEGTRTIIIKWTSNFESDDAVFLINQINIIDLFKFSFSGEEGWVDAPTVTNNSAQGTDPLSIDFNYEIKFETGDPKVVFYNEALLEEKIDIEKPFPMVKVELKEAALVGLVEIANPQKDHCCLKKKVDRSLIFPVHPYSFLDEATFENIEIEVQVCGVKNLIVQNDENLQDVNSPILPFGTRPKVGEDFFVNGGANFIIGSKEVFCKNWNEFYVNIFWKDKPKDMAVHYKNYEKPFEDGNECIGNHSFLISTSILEDGQWIEHKDPRSPVNTTNVEIPSPPEISLCPPGSISQPDNLLQLFNNYKDLDNICIDPLDPLEFREPFNEYVHKIERIYEGTSSYSYNEKSMTPESLEPYNINSRKGFYKMTLCGTSFQHSKYTFVLSKAMMDLAGLSYNPILINELLTEITTAKGLASDIKDDLQNVKLKIDEVSTIVNNPGGSVDSIKECIDEISAFITLVENGTQTNQDIDDIKDKRDDLLDLIDSLVDIDAIDSGLVDEIIAIFQGTDGLTSNITSLCSSLDLIENKLTSNAGSGDPIPENLGLPQEPYTPTIKTLSIDYTASADANDIDFIHLYPFENTSRSEDLSDDPTLFPIHSDEGTLYLGFENLTPGSTLNLLFQLAEATADSEQDRATIYWQYLTENYWANLRDGIEVTNDGTEGLTVSGIVNINIPYDITNSSNTIMPDGLFWIKVAAPKNVTAIAETISIHPQAALATAVLNPENDLSRLDNALPEGSIGKLVEGDFSVKKVQQPFPSFGGKAPEIKGHYYTRVSEQLRHKGRAINLFDFERLVLEAFPQIYKVKCISHTLGLSANDFIRDLEVAPGYIVLTVVPDLSKLTTGNLMEPKVPVSLLEKVNTYIKKITSPFIRLRVMNPRFEKVDVNIRVALLQGKSPAYYRKKLEEEIAGFLAPWYQGDSEKLAFGQPLLFSDVVGFVEGLDYIDFIEDLTLEGECNQQGTIIRPLTARSILTGGLIQVGITGKGFIREPIEEDQGNLPDKDKNKTPILH